MSVLSDGIGYESLRFYGPFQPLHIEQLQITRTINDHAYLYISGMLSEEQGAACIGHNIEQEPIAIRQLNDQGQSLRRLFHGIVTRMSVHCVRGVYTFELEAASHSYQMDIKRKRRSYQDIHRTYDGLVTALVRKYQYGDAIDTISNHAKLETFVLQYEETDWAFLKRLASRFGSVLVPEVTAASPKVFFGMPEGKQHKVERDVFYRVRKTFHELDVKKLGERAGSYITYMIESLQYYALGDLINLPIGEGKELVVVRAVTTLADGLLRTRYDLQAEQDIRYNRYENDQATGISLTGMVLKVQQDFVQLQLDIDPKQDPAKACWFPVATRYVAEEHSGWYDMPEVGEQVELYLPTHREQDAYVTDSLRQQRYINDQPNVKVWQHVQGSSVEMSEHELTLSTSGEFSITLHESSGITIDSPGNVQIQGGHVKLDAGQELSLEAGTALYLKGGASSMVLDGETDTKAPVIYQEGTVKAPVFVADLPPVPEPPLMSIKAYQAAQAPSAAKTASSSQASPPKAKVTSPAKLQQANAMMGTVSKLLGSIPVMGKVAGVVVGALSGPAAGVILRATAAIPVRSKGTPTVGGSSKRSEVHPLKYLAGLAMQGLISLHEHEKAKQAYYSKWILGKVFTSARHIAHSGGPLELVQSLLKESSAMVHSYQQIPVDLRQRWRANYDSYMAQQAKPKQEEESQSWWERALEKQGEAELLNAQLQLEGARISSEMAWDATQGAYQAGLRSVSHGKHHIDYNPKHPIAGKTGEVIGDVFSTIAGVGEMMIGTGGEVGGFLLDGTVVLSPAGVLVNVASAGFIYHGGVMSYHGASNAGGDSAELWKMIKEKNKQGSTPPKPSKPKEKPPKTERPDKPNSQKPDGTIDKPFDENGSLKPNIKYKAGEYDYSYETDGLGRLNKFETDNLQLTKRESRLDHNPKTPGKKDGDHAGHLAGDRFGGSPELDNLVSQSRKVNLSQYKKIENQWAKALKDGKEVKVKVDIEYEGDSLRPSKFNVQYEIDGKFTERSILN
ncbi:DNA/RNA non-specific endonuclease [Paenibacillus polymyxa]|uniref:DNA/RNA non-specific endonuclease n=1 Tax=Paenibacillus polymyxa TaxID=1406 RepID=UPI002024A857|nr:DNA/RNA non-specific endonuclease [Paenibacillus polymyxa]URJ35163.3 DNA/RNA non-specific endonuclease [Paenibacillus polymyxa]